MDILQGLVLGAVQGITEFFPVSSSGHLILVPTFFGWQDQGALFDVVLHAGTLVALISVFWKDLMSMAQGAFIQKDSAARRLILMIFVAAIPGLAFGGLFNSFFEENVRGASVVVFGLVFWGIILWIADRFAQKRQTVAIHRMEDLQWKHVLIVGFSQAIALFPGTSRSGITITGGLFSGLSRSAAVRFSFLVSIPTIAAAAAYGLYHLFTDGLGAVSYTELIIAFISAVIVGIWAIRFLKSYVEKKSFTPFVIYRFALAIIVLLLVS